jgi:hypothetical protein
MPATADSNECGVAAAGLVAFLVALLVEATAAPRVFPQHSAVFREA